MNCRICRKRLGLLKVWGKWMCFSCAEEVVEWLKYLR